MHPHQCKDRQQPAPFLPRSQREQHCLTDRYGSGLVPVHWEALLGQHFSTQLSQGQAALCGKGAGYSQHNLIPAAEGFITPLSRPRVLGRHREDRDSVRFRSCSLGNAWMEGMMEWRGCIRTLTLCPSGALGILLCCFVP